ncbi:MAG TPA: hypothetical protein VFZ87_00220, partial [Gemmatimonadales bacterium]
QDLLTRARDSRLATTMNDLLKQRILRLLETLDDDKAYQVLDYAEFLTSKYAQRAQPDNLFTKITATVENTMRAGKLPVQAITGTMSLMDSAAKVMKGLATAGQAVVEEAIKTAETLPRPEPAAELPLYPEQKSEPDKLSS